MIKKKLMVGRMRRSRFSLVRLTTRILHTDLWRKDLKEKLVHISC